MTAIKTLHNTATGTFLGLEYDYGVSLPTNGDSLNASYVAFIRLIDLAKQIRTSHKDIIDGGGNIGTWSIPISYSHRDLNFHTFEVQRAIFGLQYANVSINNAWNVYPNWCGLSDHCHTVDMVQPDYSITSNFGAFELDKPFKNSDDDTRRTGHVERVKMVTIDSLQLKPLFIKLDLEGMEYTAMLGGEWTISAIQPLVWAESHKSDPNVVIPFFTERNYQLVGFDNHWLFIPPWLQNNHTVKGIIGHV